MPVWSTDGTELFYRPLTVGGDDRQQTLRSVGVSMGSTLSFTSEQGVAIGEFMSFSYYRSFDAMPDGRFLVVLPAEEPTSAETPRPRFNFVLNWFDELTESVPVD